MSAPVSAPDEAEVLDVVRAALVRVLGVDGTAVDRDTRLEDLGGDSLQLVEVVEHVEADLAVRTGRPVVVDDDDLARLKTVGDAVAQVREVLRRGPTRRRR